MEPGQYRACIPFLYIEKVGCLTQRQGKIVLRKLMRSRIVKQFTQRQLVGPTLRRPWCCRVGEGLHRVRHRESQCFCWIWLKWCKNYAEFNLFSSVQSFLFSSIFSPQPPDGKPEGLDIFGLAERSYDDEIDFVVRLLTPDIVHISFPFIWKIVKGKFQPWIVDGWLRTSLCLHLCSSWKLQLDRTKGLFFLQQRDLF